MICDKCRGELKIVRPLIELEDGEGNTEIEITFCPRCKIVSEIDIPGYEVEL